MRVALVGPDGTLGSSLSKALKRAGIECTEFRRGMINQTVSVIEVADKLSRFDFVINAAAFTNIDLAEKKSAECFAANVLLPELLSQASELCGVKLLHVSTDFVFSGEASRPYRVDDPPEPINFYGQTKYQGELVVLQSPTGYVVRTSWLIKDFQTSFLGKIVRAAEDQKEIKVVSDQFGVPTHADDLAEYILNLCTGTLDQRIYHGVSKGFASRYQLAVKALDLIGYRGRVIGVRTPESKDIARRPKFGVLQPTELQNFSIGDWNEALKRIEHIS